jgi:hypothetical protein
MMSVTEKNQCWAAKKNCEKFCIYNTLKNYYDYYDYYYYHTLLDAFLVHHILREKKNIANV